MDKVQKIREKVERLMYGFNLQADIASCEDAETEKLANIKYQLCKKILEYIDTMQEEPVSDDLEKEFDDIYDKLEKEYARKTGLAGYRKGYNFCLKIARHFANWQAEQFEKNRLAACDAQTNEEAEIERDFVMSIIEKEHRQPTFDDAIKYGMRLQRENMIKEAVNGLVYAQRTNGEVMFRSNYVKKEGFEFGDKVKMFLIKED